MTGSGLRVVCRGSGAIGYLKKRRRGDLVLPRCGHLSNRSFSASVEERFEFAADSLHLREPHLAGTAGVFPGRIGRCGAFIGKQW